MRKNSIRSSLPRLIYTMILVLVVLILPVNMVFQLRIRHDRQQESSKQVFNQVEQVMKLNQQTLQEKKEEFSELCIQRADMAAYFVEHSPGVISDYDHVWELAEKLDVDEIHFFNTEGEIYAGTHPQYYGYTFSSGEQMAFFAPMLEDRDLKLCQDITPNTAEGKQMQYAAVWLEDKSGIVQIGMRPERLLKEIEADGLDSIVSGMPVAFQGSFFIVDIGKKQIVASTAEELVGMDVGADMELKDGAELTPSTHKVIHGVRYCVYREIYGNYLFVRAYVSSNVVDEALFSTGMLLGYFLVVSIGVICVILWYVNRKISRNLYRIMKELETIEEGNMENIALTTGVLEFDELISYFNQLLKSIRLSWGRVSELIDHSQVPFGIFTYNEFYKKTFVNDWMLKLLGIEKDDNRSPEELRQLILKKLSQAEGSCVDAKEKVYAHHHDGKTIYLRMERTFDEQSSTYYVMDVSDWWLELNELRTESNIDLLTGLYNRRGLYERLDELFEKPELLGRGAMVMVDADGLKRINDLYGHRIGDGYLKAIAQALESAAAHSVCARLGGDEFVLFLYGFETYKQIDEVLDGLGERRGTPTGEDSGMEQRLEFSMGQAYYPLNGENYHQLMTIADERMYLEKRERKAARA